MGYKLLGKIIAYLEVPYPITVWMMILPFVIGFLLSGAELNFFVLVLAFVFMFSYIGGFNTLNAISDVKLDLISKPHRPLPSKRLSVFEAKIFTSFLFMVFLLLVFFYYSIEIFVISVLMTFSAVFYSFVIRIKRFFILANIYLGIVYTFFPLLLGFFLFKSNLTVPLFEFFIIFLFTTLVLLCKDFEDYEADKKHQVKTFVNILGFRKALKIIFILFLLFFVFLGWSIFFFNLFIGYSFLLLLSPFNFLTIFWFYKRLDIKSAFLFFKFLTLQVIFLQISVTIIYIVRWYFV